MRLNSVLLVLFSAILLSQIGCQKLDYKKTFTVDGGSVHSINIDPPTRDQNVTVAAKAEGGTIDVYLVLESDMDSVQRSLENGTKVDESKVVKSQKNSNDVSFEGKVPAKKGYGILITTAEGKKAEVTLNVKAK